MSNLHRTNVLIAVQKEASAVENSAIFYRTGFFLLIIKLRRSLEGVFLFWANFVRRLPSRRHVSGGVMVVAGFNLAAQTLQDIPALGLLLDQG